MSCTFYRWNGGIFGDYWCDIQNARVNTNDYSKYCSNYNYSECPIYKRQNNSSGCFITTIVCNILRKKDDDRILQTLRSFRNNVLQQNKEYYTILKEYDTIGPLIANCIENDEYKEQVAFEVYQNWIISIYYLIYHQKYEEAINKYRLMTQKLIDNYGLTEQYHALKENNYYYPEFNPETAGHGKRKVKSIEITQNL